MGGVMPLVFLSFNFLSPLGERLGEGVPKAVRNPLTQPLPLAGERRKNFQVGERRKIVLQEERRKNFQAGERSKIVQERRG